MTAVHEWHLTSKMVLFCNKELQSFSQQEAHASGELTESIQTHFDILSGETFLITNDNISNVIFMLVPYFSQGYIPSCEGFMGRIDLLICLQCESRPLHLHNKSLLNTCGKMSEHQVTASFQIPPRPLSLHDVSTRLLLLEYSYC